MEEEGMGQNTVRKAQIAKHRDLGAYLYVEDILTSGLFCG